MKTLQNNYVLLLFLGLGFLLYGNTLNHEFALDDAIVINDNSFTKKGFSGIWDQLSNDQFMGFYGEKKELVSGGRYRPLSMVVFNLQYAIAGENATFSHLINVLFYILNGFLLFLLLHRLLPDSKRFYKWLPLSLLVSLLWFFHPIHTEVVANIKGLDEIMAFCFELMTLWFVLNYLDSKKIIELVKASLLFFLALLSKENAITWLALIPLVIYFFTGHSFKKAIPVYLAIFFSSLVWLFIRYQIVGGGISNVADNIMNDPFLESSVSEKYATIVYTLGKYIQLLIFPHPLTYDYYPKQIPIVSWTKPYVLLSLMTYVVMGVFALIGFFKKSIPAFGILLFLITLSIASNIFFPIGAFMNERFVYVSSLGFCLIIGYLIMFSVPNSIKSAEKSRQVSIAIVSIFLLLYSIKTISRNPVWKNNLTLATNDANISINGAKSNVMAGGLLTEEAAKTNNPKEKRKLLQQAIFYLNRAINIYPDYIDALLLMGNAQWEFTNNVTKAMPYYYRILGINNQHPNAWQNSFIILEQSKNVDNKINAYQTLLKYNPNKAQVYLNLGRAYGREKNNLNQSIAYLEQGRKIAPSNIDILTNLGTAYGLQKNYPKAIEVLEKAIELKPTVSKIHIDLGLSYYYSGQNQKAIAAFDKAASLDNKIDRSNFPL